MLNTKEYIKYKLGIGLSLLIESDDDIDWEGYEILDEVRRDVMSEYLHALMDEKPGIGNNYKYIKSRQEWQVLPFSTIKRMWEEFIRWGYVKPNYIKTLEEMERIVTVNVFKVCVNTELMGHTPSDPKYYWKEYIDPYHYESEYKKEAEEELGLESYDEFIDYIDEHIGGFMEDERGQWRISDYGLKPLLEKVSELRKIQDPNKKLVKIDEIFNVVHQRSDIAGWFVEGGSRALSELSEVNHPPTA